jgi:hypothetical protein
MTDSILSQSQYLSEPVTEIKGRPGIIWGKLVVPTGIRSRITIKLIGNLLQSNVRLAFGLENKEIKTRLQDIGSIEIAEGRLWWLLWIGIPTLFPYLIGIIFIVLFFVIKQRWLVIYTKSVNLIVFYKRGENIEQFREAVFAALQENPSTSAQ